MARLVLDSSVLIAFLDPGDAHHDGATSALAAGSGDELVLPATAFAESLVHPYRLGRGAVERFEQLVSDFAMHVEPIGADIAREAARLRAGKSSITLPDALVLATGKVIGATTVLTADEAWPKVSRLARTI